METREVFDLLIRDCTAMYGEKSVKEKLLSGRKLKIKMGADPSRPDLHVGHSVVLRKLKLLQELGHEIIFVIGDFTAMIGDPSGQSNARAPLSFEQTRKNGQTYFRQVTKILDPVKTRIVYNSEWLGKMDFAQVLQLAGKYTLARILERDDFANRFAANAPIGLHELLYPLMQGYDSVHLGCDIEVGGSDQTFNLLVGRDLQRDYGQSPQDVITFSLLPGLDGKEKMSKSLNNYIGIDEPASVMFEKAMCVPDGLMKDYLRLTTDLPEDSYLHMLNEDIHRAHFLYAATLVRIYYNQDLAQQAEKRYREIASGRIPEVMDTIVLDSEETGLTEIIVRASLAASKSEARRLIAGHGVRVDGITADFSILLSKGLHIINVGKAKFIRIIIPE